MEKLFKIFIENNQNNVLASQGESVLESLLGNKQDIDNSCGGGGTCGTCRILVSSDLKSLPKRNSIENEMAEDRKFNADERLACQLYPTAHISIKIPK
jgi:ferredoxin